MSKHTFDIDEFRPLEPHEMDGRTATFYWNEKTRQCAIVVEGTHGTRVYVPLDELERYVPHAGSEA